MEDRFPEEEYRRVCSALKPSFQAEQEVVNMAEPGKRPWRKKKAFVTLAAVLALTLSGRQDRRGSEGQGKLVVSESYAG